jgi:hypothetical protein
MLLQDGYWQLKACRIFSAKYLATCNMLKDMLSTFKVSVIEGVTGRSSPCRKKICHQ